MDAKDMLLDDALETAIRSQRTIIIMKRIISIMGITIAVLITLLIGG